MLRGKYTPRDPVAYGEAVACPGQADGSVLSVVHGDNAELMDAAARLWITDDDFVADVTFGNGAFWKKNDRIVAGTDLALDGTDCRDLPYEDEVVDVVVLDPPYQPQHGQPGRDFGVGRTYRIGESGLQTITDVLDLYDDAIAEAGRVLKHGGRLLVKCQDLTYNHRLHLVHLDVLRRMTWNEIGLADMFVLANKNRMPQRAGPQQRARRAHSYLLVGVKP